MKTTTKAQWVLLTIACLSVPLMAQHATGQMGILFSAGAHKLVGGATDQSIVNPFASAALSVALSQRVDLETGIDVGWVRPRDPDSQFKILSGAPYRTYLYPIYAMLKYRFKKEAAFTPFVGGGAGLTYWNLRDVSQEDEWFPYPESGTIVGESRMNASLLVSAGFSYFISKTISVTAEGRYNHMIDQDIDNIGLGQDTNNGLLNGRLTLGFHFGGRHDSDGDGILDEYDSDPEHPEDFDGFQDGDGKPDPDNDNDGIPDIVDKAPNQPEDIDGFQDEDGIPDLDNDNDGIPDVYDRAPLQPEDKDGFQDEDGVPDPDNDGDGIPDVRDPEPNVHKDKIQEEKVVQQQEEAAPLPPAANVPLVLRSVVFETGSDVLTTQAINSLRAVAHSLIQNPTVQIEIRGYTDSVGSAIVNLELSQKRAQAVVAFLTMQGVDASRLRAVGYGEAAPIASNSSPEGRAQNRRIEMVQLED